MSASRFCLNQLPVEVLEKIFLRLPDQDIVKMEAICWRFQDLARASPTLQYRRELFSAGLMDNPHHPCDLAERRRLCMEYVHKWSDPANMANFHREVPLEHGPSNFWVTTAGRNLLMVRSHSWNTVSFTYVPPAMSRKPIERWNLPPFRFNSLRQAAYPPKNILVALEMRERSIRLHLLNLLDGTPYRISPSNIITWEHPQVFEGTYIRTLAMTASKLMMSICIAEGSTIWRVIVWDWETGDLVFNRSSADGSNLIGDDCQVVFLDEFRIALTHRNNAPVGPELLVFNTLIPQDNPRNVRRFRLPSKYRNWRAYVRLDHDRSLGVMNRGGPLITDPTQSVFIVDLSLNLLGQRELLVLRVQPMIELACSMRADVQIPWDEWGRGSVAVGIPMSLCRHVYLITVHGARLLVIHSTDYADEHPYIRIFDFSRGESAALPLSDANDDGTERRILFKHGRRCAFKPAKGTTPWALEPIGDSVVRVEPKIVPPPDESFNVLHVLDLM